MWHRLLRYQHRVTSSSRTLPLRRLRLVYNLEYSSNTITAITSTTASTLRAQNLNATRRFSTSHPSRRASLPPRPTLPDDELKHTYLKGSGPGGQKINKTSSAVQLTHLPTGIVVKSQATRSRSQNHTIARRILAEKIELLQRGDDSRAAKVVERKQQKKQSASKKKRRKYRKLAEGDESKEDGVAGTGGVRTDQDGNDDDDDIWEEEDSDDEVDLAEERENGKGKGNGIRRKDRVPDPGATRSDSSPKS